MDKEVKVSNKNFFDKVKYNYRLLFHPEKIEISKNLPRQEQEKIVKRIYKDKIALHKKLGAERFRKFVLKLDKCKYKFLKNIIGTKRVISFTDKVYTKTSTYSLKKAKTEAEKQEIISNLQRNKVLLRKQLNEEKSINYYVGVDRRIEQFSKYLLKNKQIHQGCLVRNGLIFGGCVVAGLCGAPIVPMSLLGSYQVIAAMKNIQCINLQDYNLTRAKLTEQRIVKQNMRRMKEKREENKELIKDINKAKEKEQKSLSTKDAIESLINNATTKETLEQMRAILIQEKSSQKSQAPVGMARVNSVTK